MTCVSWGPWIFGKWLPSQLFPKRKEKDVEPWKVSSGIFEIRTVQQYNWWCITILEELVCCLFIDLKIKKVDELRVKLFKTWFNGDGKNIDLIGLPSCCSDLRLHINRTCYVANMFHHSRRLMMLQHDPVEHGRDLNGKVRFSEKWWGLKDIT